MIILLKYRSLYTSGTSIIFHLQIMTRAVKGQIIEKTFSFPFRMILAGSSGAGKTFFAGELLKRDDLFEDQVSAVHFYFPCYLPEAPINWHKTLNKPVSYHVGLPSKSDQISKTWSLLVVTLRW